MPYVITEAGIDVKDQLYIHPVECIDWKGDVERNAAFFRTRARRLPRRARGTRVR